MGIFSDYAKFVREQEERDKKRAKKTKKKYKEIEGW